MNDASCTAFSTRAILEDARKLIERPESWAKMSCKTGQHCAHTAICAARPIFSDTKEAVRVFCQVVAPGTEGMGNIWSWNDKPERTHAEVLAAFDKAIAECAP